MTPEQQLERWVAGESVHRGKKPGGECCPDFSCCRPNLQWPQETRQAFMDADEAGREFMMVGALAGMLSDEGHEVNSRLGVWKDGKWVDE